MIINMHEAKTTLSRLVESVENGVEPSVFIARNGKPVACLIPISTTPLANRLGIAQGKFTVPKSIDDMNDDIANLFTSE